MAGGLPIVDDTAGYILSSALTILVYDVVTHMDEEIDYIARSRSTFVKAIFILCRYLSFVIGALRIYEVVGEGYIDNNFCLVLMRSSIWLSFVLNLFSSCELMLYGAGAAATYVTGLVSLKIYTGALPAEACYGPDNPGASWLVVSFVALISLEIGLFGMSMYRVISKYRTSSGQLLHSLVGHNIVYFAASVALNILNIVNILLASVETTWPTGIMEIVQILFQGLLATRMQLDLWKVDRRAVESTMITMSMAEFAVVRAESTVYQNNYLATPNC